MHRCSKVFLHVYEEMLKPVSEVGIKDSMPANHFW